MSKIILAALMAVLAYSLTGCGQALPSATGSNAKSFSARSGAQQELLVKFKSSITPSSISIFHAQHGVRTVRVIPALNVHVMIVTNSRSLSQVLAQVSKSPMVEYAEPNQGVSLNDDQPRL